MLYIYRLHLYDVVCTLYIYICLFFQFIFSFPSTLKINWKFPLSWPLFLLSIFFFLCHILRHGNLFGAHMCQFEVCECVCLCVGMYTRDCRTCVGIGKSLHIYGYRKSIALCLIRMLERNVLPHSHMHIEWHEFCVNMERKTGLAISGVHALLIETIGGHCV